MGKGIANGLPLSAYGASAEIVNQWPVGAHGTTYGGNPVACAAASKVIEVMEPLLPHARDLSKRAFERFEELKSRHQTIGDVRGLGLMVGVELVSDREARTPDAEAMEFISAYGIDHELIVIACGPDGNVIRFIPPLTASMEELDAAIGVVGAALSDYEAR
jgi:4-aminobutyrate aminotransferase